MRVTARRAPRAIRGYSPRGACGAVPALALGLGAPLALGYPVNRRLQAAYPPTDAQKSLRRPCTLKSQMIPPMIGTSTQKPVSPLIGGSRAARW
jgi:hypothetical protein